MSLNRRELLTAIATGFAATAARRPSRSQTVAPPLDGVGVDQVSERRRRLARGP